MNRPLIEQLYDAKDCEHIRNLYNEDSSVRSIIQKSISNKIQCSGDKIICNHSLDTVFLICCSSTFATLDESNKVAIIVYSYIDVTDPFPSILEYNGSELAERAFISLSFFYKRMEYKWKYKGAPSPAFYRGVSKQLFRNNNNSDIADHFEQWENFLSERFI